MPKTPRRPPGGWKDARILGKKLKAIRVGRGVTLKKAAAQLGIDSSYYGKLEIGSFLPPRWMQERLFRWAVKGETFHLREPRGQSQVAKAAGWEGAKVRLPPALNKKMQIVGQRLGMTNEELLLLGVEKLINDPGELTSYQRAMDRLERVKVSQALSENPTMRLFLEAELALCVDMGAELTKAKPKQPTPPLKIEEGINMDELDLSDWELV